MNYVSADDGILQSGARVISPYLGRRCLFFFVRLLILAIRQFNSGVGITGGCHF